MDLKKCDECGKSFHYQSGQFSNHLNMEHNLSLKDYIIKYEYDNEPNNLPKCQCGYCDKVTPFYRGKFKENFAFREHRSFKWKKEQYIKNNGIPKCRCGNDILEFNRGIPKKFCRECINKNDHHRFNDGVFKKGTYYGKDGMLKKYGVEYPSQLKHVKEQQSKRINEYNSNWKKNHSLKKYKNTDLYYQSTFELDFLKLCEAKEILYQIKNGNCYNYLNEDSNNGKRLFTDFSMNNSEIEIKSSYILKQQGGLKKLFAKKRAVESTGKKYIFILDKDYMEFEESLL